MPGDPQGPIDRRSDRTITISLVMLDAALRSAALCVPRRLGTAARRRLGRRRALDAGRSQERGRASRNALPHPCTPLGARIAPGSRATRARRQPALCLWSPPHPEKKKKTRPAERKPPGCESSVTGSVATGRA